MEIQRAHDLLISVLIADGLEVGGLPFGLNGGQFADIAAYASVFCWLLGHEHNTHFGQHLQHLEEMLSSRGFVLLDSGVLHLGRGPVN